MRVVNRREFGAVLAAAAAAPLPEVRGPRGHAAGLGIKPPAEPFFAALPKLMEVAGVPGVGIGVVRAGRPLWARYEGVADTSTGQPVGPETLFPAASLGKPVFALAALRLADDGRLDLDRPLKTYVPDHAPGDARGDRVTARHVLTHSTGYPNWRSSSDQPLVPEFEPGTRFQYSGEGFYYLQRAVEKIGGRGFEQFMEERLFEPLGMRSSTYSWRVDTAARLVTGHRRGTPVRGTGRAMATQLFQYAQDKGRPLASMTHEEIVTAIMAISPSTGTLPNSLIPNAAGSLVTTVSDYAAFVARVLAPATDAVEPAPATRQQMLAPQTRVNSALSWGLGWGLERDQGREYFWHWGDNGPFKNFVLAHLPSRSGIAVFTNGQNGLRVAEAVVAAASGRGHFAFDWL